MGLNAEIDRPLNWRLQYKWHSVGHSPLHCPAITFYNPALFNCRICQASQDAHQTLHNLSWGLVSRAIDTYLTSSPETSNSNSNSNSHSLWAVLVIRPC